MNLEFATLRHKLYEKIRCPECGYEKGFKYNRKGIICENCQTKYKVINGTPILFSKESKKTLKIQLKSRFGKQMIDEYSKKKSVLNYLKIFFKIPDLFYNLVDRKKLHKIFTYNENPKYIVLNVGGGPTREDKNVLNLNIDLFPNVEVVADAHNLPFKSNSVDSVMIAAVLEHVQNPNKVVEEAYRVLKKDGYIYAETPFLQHFHGYPNHFQNFTLIGHDYLFRKFKKIESGPTTGSFSTVSILTLNLVEDFISNKYLRKIIMFAVAFVLYSFKYFDKFLKKNKNTFKITNGVYFLGQKI